MNFRNGLPFKHQVFCGALFSLTAVAAFAQHPSEASAFNPGVQPVTADSLQAEQFAEDAWFAHLKVLAGDDLNGRKTGTPDFLRAVEYVEGQFKAIGLKPAGVEGYRQPGGFRSALVDSEHSTVALVHQDGPIAALKVGEEVVLSPNKDGDISAQAPAVF